VGRGGVRPRHHLPRVALRVHPQRQDDILRLPTWDGFAVAHTAAGEWLHYETLAARKLAYNGCPTEPACIHPNINKENTVSETFTREEIEAVYKAIALRRDVRHFIPGPVDETVLARLLTAAHQAPSVGMMQPWRFIRILRAGLRDEIVRIVEEERLRTAEALGERGREFMRLKVEGIRECGELLVVALMDRREHHVFGRRTLPEMDLASVACAIQNIWLASRAEGLGMGWVSLFDPDRLGGLLNIPSDAKPVAILCLGHVEQFYPKPMLELEGWATPRRLGDLVSEDGWQPQQSTPPPQPSSQPSAHSFAKKKRNT